MPQSSDNKKQRSTKPVAPENSALADELRSQLKGKPTKCGFNRSWIREAGSFISDIIKIGVVLILCLVFTFGGFGAGLLGLTILSQFFMGKMPKDKIVKENK